jgi:hypothetical protein
LKYGFWEDGRDEHCDTVAAKGTEGAGRKQEEEKGKTKGGEGSNEHYDTVAAKGTEGQGESKREEKGKTKGGEGSNEHYDTVAAKGTEGQILYSLYIIGKRVIFENKYLLTLAHLYIVINYANHSMSATLL